MSERILTNHVQAKSFVCLSSILVLSSLVGCQPSKVPVDVAQSTQKQTVAATKTNAESSSKVNSPPSVENGSADQPNEMKAKAPVVSAKTNIPNAWETFRGNAQSTGVAEGTISDELTTQWKHTVNGGAFESTAAIVTTPENPERKIAFIGDLDGSLFAFDLSDGSVIWEYKAEIGFVAGAAYRDGLVYLGDLDGIFHCVDMKGNKVWTLQTNAEINSSANFYKDMVLFGSQDTYLYAVDAKTGELRWNLETADQVRCGLTIAGNQAFVAGCDGGLHLIDLDNGTEISSADIQSPTGVTPAVLDHRAFVGTEQAGFFGIDWKKGAVDWHFDTQGAPVRGSAAVTDKQVVVGAQNRTVYSIDPKTGNEQWATTLKAKIDSSPVIVGDRILIGSSDGRLYGLNLKDGTPVWEKQLDSGITGSVAVGFDRVIVATERGVVYCLGSPTP